MEVLVNNSKKSTYWYSNKIGESFHVEELLIPSNLDIFRLMDTTTYRPKYILKSDCEVLNE